LDIKDDLSAKSIKSQEFGDYNYYLNPGRILEPVLEWSHRIFITKNLSLKHREIFPQELGELMYVS
jgi:hypothetical protein